MEKLYQLQCFSVTARTQNISEAARLLHISQPSLSQTIRRLEEDLGYCLFDRKGKRIFLNENGRIILQAVERMSNIYHGALQEVEELGGRICREVSVYIGCASLHLPGLLTYLKKQSPQVKYHIFQWRENGMHENDIGLVALEGSKEDYFSSEKKDGGEMVYQGKQYEILFEEEIVLAVPTRHPLAKKRSVALKDLMGEDVICLNENWSLGKLVHENLKHRAQSPEASVWVDNPSLMRDLLKKGLGIALVPSVSWEGFAGNDVAMKRIRDFDVRRTVCVCWNRDKYLTRQEKDCIRWIREYFLEFAGAKRHETIPFSDSMGR